jgi:hypothetical protein
VYDAPEKLLDTLRQVRLKSGVFYIGGSLPIMTTPVAGPLPEQNIFVQGSGNIVAGGNVYVDADLNVGRSAATAKPLQHKEFDFRPHRAVTLVLNVPSGTRIWGEELYGPLAVKGEVGGLWRESGNGVSRTLAL